MVYVVPVPKLTPPVELEYQLIVPIFDDALKLTVPIPHLLAGAVEVIVGKFTVAVTALRVEEQPLFVTST